MNIFTRYFAVSITTLAMLVIGMVPFTVKAKEAKQTKDIKIGMAVEFMDHAACAYVAKNKGWFEQEGLNFTAYESYVTGMALAAALARGDIQVAYICLVPAINVYANAKVPIKIVAGTHKYGYGLVVNYKRIKKIRDLENPTIRLGCVREGGAVDVLLHRAIDRHHLDEGKVLNNVRRMNPPQQILAIKTGQLDAAFLPEQWATMAEGSGFKMFLTSQDLWPRMQGSVLVIKQGLIEGHPEVVRKLVKVTKMATDWINQHPDEAAEIVARQLSITGRQILPAKAARIAVKLKITPLIISRSMNRLVYTTDLDPEIIQDTINYISELGYIKRVFKVEDILDLRYLHGK